MTETINMIYEFLTMYWFVFLFVLFVVYQIYDHYSFKSLLEKVGIDYCVENDHEYIGIKHAKGHFSVIYKTTDNERRKYKKFRMNAFLGKIKYLEWLK